VQRAVGSGGGGDGGYEVLRKKTAFQGARCISAGGVRAPKRATAEGWPVPGKRRRRGGEQERRRAAIFILSAMAEEKRRKESAGVGPGAGRTREEERKGWMRTRDRVRSLLAASLRSRLSGFSCVLRKLLRLAAMDFNRLYSGKSFIAAFISTVLELYSALEQQVLLFCGKGGPVRRCPRQLCVFSNADVVGGCSYSL
jgi:hypothetical protein